jgi:ATP-binding cassette subfamily G (WHITE) protein 2 (SNQ2)
LPAASSILFGALSSMAEIPALFGQRPIVDRHHKNAMYHPFVEAISLTVRSAVAFYDE